MTLINAANALRLGNQAVAALYCGATKVWPSLRPTYEQTVLVDNPIGYWPLTDLTDLSGNGRDLTQVDPVSEVADRPSLIVDGPVNGAKFFHGFQTIGFSRADDAGLSSTANLCFEIWSKPSEIYAHWMILKGSHGVIMRSNGRVAWEVLTNLGPTWIDSTTLLVVNQVYHIVGMSQGGTHRLYINGVLEASITYGASLVDEANPLVIGGIGGSSGKGTVTGTLDEAAVYNHALSPERILAHYQVGSSSSIVPAPSSHRDVVMAHTPLGYWRKFPEAIATDNIAQDSSGNGLYLTVYNPPGVLTSQPSLIPTDLSDPAMGFVGGANLWNPQHYSAFDLTTAVSISVWMKPSQLPSTWMDVVRKESVYGIEISGVDKKVRGVFSPGGFLTYTGHSNGAAAFKDPTVVIQVDTVYHVVFTYDSTIHRGECWVNGVLDSWFVGIINPAPLVSVFNQSFVIGTFDKAVNGFNGVIDEVALFNLVLTADDIGDLYRSGIGS